MMSTWQEFKKHKRSLVALYLFLISFMATLICPLITNDKPLVIHVNDSYYFPIFENVNQQTLGGSIPMGINFLSPSFQDEIAAKGGYVVYAPIPFSYNTIDFENPEPFPAAPSSRHLIGTDAAGHDVLAILLYGLRISLIFGILLTIASTLIGVFVGGACGYFGGKIDLWGQRFLEMWSSLPTLYILIILSSMVENGFWMLLSIMILVSWMSIVGIVRAEFLKVRHCDFALASRIMGASHWYIATRHVLPNALTATLTMLPFILCGAIVALSSLDFLGFGLPAESPSIGKLMLSAKQNLQAPWLAFAAFGTLTAVLTLLILIGEGLRDALDPRQKKYS